MKKTEETFTDYYTCDECRAGNLRPRRVTYFTWMGDELISVPDFPAWVCDVCGKLEYDLKAVNRLTMILDPNAGRPTTKRRRTPPPPRPQTGAPRPIRDS